MIPILYSSEEEYFMTNGIGLLSDAVSCKCTEKLNSEYEIELKIPRTGEFADRLAVNEIIKAKPNYDDSNQLFRIYLVEKNYDDFITAKAAHISYDTAGIPVLPFTSNDLGEAVSYMNTNRLILNESPFVLNADFDATGTLEIKSPASFRSILGGSDNSINEIYGGDYHYDNYVINLVQKRGSDKGICFRYGKNIADFEQKVDSENVFSSVVGFWKKSGSNGEADTIIYGDIIQCDGIFPYDKIYVLDTTSSIKTENDALATTAQINDVVKDYILKNSIGFPQVKMKIDYVDDDNIIKVCLGDRVGVVYPEYNINLMARCNKVVFNCLEEKNESIEIGVEDEDLSDSIVKASNKET